MILVDVQFRFLFLSFFLSLMITSFFFVLFLPILYSTFLTFFVNIFAAQTVKSVLENYPFNLLLIYF